MERRDSVLTNSITIHKIWRPDIHWMDASGRNIAATNWLRRRQKCTYISVIYVRQKVAQVWQLTMEGRARSRDGASRQKVASASLSLSLPVSRSPFVLCSPSLLSRDDFGGPRNTHTLTDIGNPLTDPIDDS